MLVRIALALASLAVPSPSRIADDSGLEPGAGPGTAPSRPDDLRELSEPRQYSLTEVGASDAGDATGAAGLSDSGLVAGSLIPRGKRSAPVGYRWSPAAGPQAPKVLVPEQARWAGSSAVDVNEAGTLVGSFAEGSGALTHGYRWKDGVIEELLTPLGLRAFPTALNDAGWIVGYAGIQPSGTPGAVQWSPELEPRFLGDMTRAVDINAHGMVVGNRNDAGGIARGFLWDGCELVPLGSLDPRGVGAVYPKAIDDRGRVVGVSLIRGREHAFRWTRAGGMVELTGPKLRASAATGGSSRDVAALDLNEAGWVIGYDRGAGGEEALLWSPDGAVRPLATLVPALAGAGAGELRAQRINASGQIAGTLSKAGEVRSVVLTPSPPTRVPGAVGMLLR